MSEGLVELMRRYFNTRGIESDSLLKHIYSDLGQAPGTRQSRIHAA
jgi:hypothetical protein